MAPEHVVIIVAPISDIATISPSTVGSLSKLNSLLMYKTAPATKTEIVHELDQVGKSLYDSVKTKTEKVVLING